MMPLSRSTGRACCAIAREIYVAMEMEIEAVLDAWDGKIWDDVSGNELKRELVEAAREEEMREFDKHKVYEKVPITECWEVTGKALLGIR